MRLAAGLCLSAPPNPLAAKRGPTSKGGDGGGKGKGGEGRGGEGKERGKEGDPLD